MTSIFHNLTKGSVWTDVEDDVSRMRVGGSKGQLLTTMAEVGAEDTGSDGYQ